MLLSSGLVAFSLQRVHRVGQSQALKKTLFLTLNRMKFNLECSELNGENPKRNETVQIEQRQQDWEQGCSESLKMYILKLLNLLIPYLPFCLIYCV